MILCRQEQKCKNLKKKLKTCCQNCWCSKQILLDLIFLSIMKQFSKLIYQTKIMPYSKTFNLLFYLFAHNVLFLYFNYT